MTRKKRWFYDSVKHGVPFDPISKRLIEERTGISIGSGMVGPWQAGDKGSTYYVLNVETGEKKKFGSARMKGVNWWERAKAEARHRNELVENQRNYPWLFRKGGKAGVLKELEQVLYTDRIGGNLGHQVIDEAYSRCEIAGCTTKDLNKVLARVDERVKAGERIVGGGKKRHSTAYNHAVTGTLRRPAVIAAAKELRAINRKLPKMGWGVRMPDGRELLHDRNGYYYVGEADGGKGGGKKRHGSSSLPVEGDECPVCQSGTVVLEEGELRCAGECGKIWKLPRGSKKRGVGAQVAELNKLLK
jgi:hypothetical protein